MIEPVIPTGVTATAVSTLAAIPPTKPRRRLFEVLKAEGLTDNQQVTFLTDGFDDIRDLPRFLNPDSDHLLDWFHLITRITVMTNRAKLLQPPPPDPDLSLTAETATCLVNQVRDDLERLRWFCWYDNFVRAMQTNEGITIDLETRCALATSRASCSPQRGSSTPTYTSTRRDPRLRRALPGRRNHLQPAGRVRRKPSDQQTHGQKQQMRWTQRGAQLLFQLRTRVLNNNLANDFRAGTPTSPTSQRHRSTTNQLPRSSHGLSRSGAVSSRRSGEQGSWQRSAGYRTCIVTKRCTRIVHLLDKRSTRGHLTVACPTLACFWETPSLRIVGIL